jgi:uncharacterized surface protein with fasciclin (FAS1) repeats
MTARIAGWAAAALLMAGCATSPAPAPVPETAARAPQLTTLTKLIQQAGLAEALRGAGPYTLFAPSDDAFKAVPARTLAELSADPARLKAVLSYHVVPGRLTTDAVKNGNQKSLEGAVLAVAKAGSFVTVEDALVQQADLGASNGVVHVIDRVLLPPRR